MKNTTYQAWTQDDTIVCQSITNALRIEMVRHATVELCEAIVAEVEFRALCNLIKANNPIDMSDHATLEN